MNWSMNVKFNCSTLATTSRTWSYSLSQQSREWTFGNPCWQFHLYEWIKILTTCARRSEYSWPSRRNSRLTSHLPRLKPETLWIERCHNSDYLGTAALNFAFKIAAHLILSMCFSGSFIFASCVFSRICDINGILHWLMHVYNWLNESFTSMCLNHSHLLTYSMEQSPSWEANQ
jgi:hypothetical protein